MIIAPNFLTRRVLQQASQLLSLMKEFNEESSTLSESKMMKMMEEFGMDEEGHIDYEHFVSVLMSLTVN